MGTVAGAEVVDRPVRRAGAFAAVATLSLLLPLTAGRAAAPIATAATTLPFLVIAAASLVAVDDGPVFDAFARHTDREEGRLYGLAGFSLAIAGLTLLVALFGLPPDAFVATVLLVGYGNLGQRAIAGRYADPAVAVTAFAATGTVVAGMGMAATVALVDVGRSPVEGAFLITSGALLAGLLRVVLSERDDPLVLVSVALLLWLFSTLPVSVSPTRFGLGLALALGFGGLAYSIDAASVSGMVTGVALALFAAVLGGFGWFAVLIAFFGLGGLASKFRYEEKCERGIAQPDRGARSSANVLANSAAGLVSVIGFAGAGSVGAPPDAFLFAFAGSIAAAMSDTFSSEFGGLYDDPVVITTFERVDPGTDGAVTWQGYLAGLAGAAIVAAIGLPFFGLTPSGVALIVAAGFLGMTVDSLLGATIEGGVVDNQGVNLVATLTAAIAAGVLSVPLGLA